ncbi:hypothetical protein V502_02635 [Pseudogymnoascus sp. VKM F-4520 (FW-2644)]|nr:hypothetical protein V502_02635 [Pseudogymnoascus sp. VKM F-4520 (FW-2644)]
MNRKQIAVVFRGTCRAGGDVRSRIRVCGMGKLREVISTTYQNNGHEQERKMSNQQEWVVSKDMSRTAEQVQAELERFFIMNEEYNKVICIGEGCRKAIKARAVQGHLQRRHNVEGGLSKRIADVIGEEVGWRWRPSNKRLPVNGLGPQKGLEVFDRFQCRFCNELPARSVEEVEHHLYEMHRETEGHIWDEVRVQSWGGEGRFRDECWVVDERKYSGGKGIMEVVMDEKVVEEAAPAEEATVDDAPAEEEVVGEAAEETAEEESAEENDRWSTEDGMSDEGKEKKMMEEWVGDCFTWRWREIEARGWDEMDEGWVVMY